MNEQEIAQVLKDSGLFDLEADCGIVHGPYGKLLTADKAEVVLGKMCRKSINFEVNIHVGRYIEVITNQWSPTKNSARSQVSMKSGMTHALNEIIAWCCENMKPELEKAI